MNPMAEWWVPEYNPTPISPEYNPTPPILNPSYPPSVQRELKHQEVWDSSNSSSVGSKERLEASYARGARWVAENATDEVFDIAKEIDAQALNLWWETLSYDDVRRAKNKGMSVNIWTANDPAKVRSMVDWGVQGFMSDCPQNYHF